MPERKTAFRRIVKVVTAFTLGHSITLVLGALGWARLPGAFVESAIALSILVSAVHALVPIFRGREVFIAGGFGLVHGLAFAATLTDFGFDPWTLVSSVLGFNLGIEAFQLLVILAAMPWLVLLARSRVYGPFRVTGAALTGIAAVAWFAERAFGWSNPIVPLVEGCRVARPLAARRPGRPHRRRHHRRKQAGPESAKSRFPGLNGISPFRECEAPAELCWRSLHRGPLCPRFAKTHLASAQARAGINYPISAATLPRRPSYARVELSVRTRYRTARHMILFR